jgi:hypothetical protein
VSRRPIDHILTVAFFTCGALAALVTVAVIAGWVA